MTKIIKLILLIVLLAILGIGTYYFFNRKKALNIIIPQLNDIENIHITFLGDTALVDLNLNITNKGLFKIHLDTLAYHVQLDTSTLLSKSEYVNLELARSEQDTIHLPLKLPFKRLMAKIKSLQTQDSVNIPIELRLVYSTIFGKAVLPYSKTVRIEVPHPPKFEIEKIEFVKRDKKTLYMSAHIKMYNYSKIDLNVSGLSYTLTTKRNLFTASGKSGQNIHVKPKSVISKALPVKIEFKKVFKTLGLVITNNDKVKYHITVTGFIQNDQLNKEKTPIEIEKDGILELKK